ncbi:MAG: hypothetical protein ACRDE8_10310, partial [Ginsengibacter sp.]
NLFFVLLTLLTANRFLIKGKAIVNEYFTCFIIGALVYISFMIRNQSIVLLPSIILVQIIKSRRHIFSLKNILLIAIPVASFLFFLFLSTELITVKSVTYLDQYANLQFGKTVWENIFYYADVWRELFVTTYLINNFTATFTGFFLIFALIGAFTRVKQNMLFIIFFTMTLALVLISPFYQGLRYLMPVIPFLFYFFITGFSYAVSHIHRGNKFKALLYYSLTGIIIFLSINTILVRSHQSSISRQEADGPYKKTSIEMFDYIRNNSAKNEMIGFCKPRAMLLYTGRNAMIPVSYNECIKRNISYLVYYKRTTVEQLPLDSVKSHADNLHQVFGNDDFIICKVQMPGL